MKFKSIAVIDLETTNITSAKITELSIIACEREHCTNSHVLPRVLHKISLCVNPPTKIHPMVTSVTGLDNYDLANVSSFNHDVVNIIRLFLQRIPPPVCLIAHNGNKFDFPILRREIERSNESFPVDLHCADSCAAFRQMFSRIPNPEPIHIVPELKDALEDSMCLEGLELAEKSLLELRSSNESTPKRKSQPLADVPKKNKTDITRENNDGSKVRRRLTMSEDEETCENRENQSVLTPITTQNNFRGHPASFKLKHIYEYLYGYEFINAHRAENDATALLECIVKVGERFFDWIDENALPFSSA